MAMPYSYNCRPINICPTSMDENYGHNGYHRKSTGFTLANVPDLPTVSQGLNSQACCPRAPELILVSIPSRVNQIPITKVSNSQHIKNQEHEVGLLLRKTIDSRISSLYVYLFNAFYVYHIINLYINHLIILRPHWNKSVHDFIGSS